MDISENSVDDAGTGQSDAKEILRSFRDNGFDGDSEKTGLVLGRPAGEIDEMIDGDTDVDDDLAMKIRGVAEERGITLD